MRAAWHPHAGMSQTKASRPMIKRGLARRRRNEGVDARQFLFLDIDGGLAECPWQSAGGPTNRDKIYPSIRTRAVVVGAPQPSMAGQTITGSTGADATLSR